jgi:membrane-bound lytic murein transglycosylase MltF
MTTGLARSPEGGRATGLGNRKDSPQLRQLLDEFINGRQVGTLFGNILLNRYLQNTHWVKDATSTEELKKFQAYARYFQKYGAEYDFDYLMLVAQGYEESGLDQSLRNPSSAMGIMQVIPQYAAAPPISIPNVEIAEDNIHAGAKMMRNIADNYFNDPKLDPLNKTLMTFANWSPHFLHFHLVENVADQIKKPVLQEG